MMDTNVDTSNSGHNKSWNVEKLKIILFDFLNLSNIMIHNKRLTHFSSIYDDSCIDHIFSNCPNFISPVITDRVPDSDHAILHCTYTSHTQITHPKFAFLRQYHKLTTFKLTEHIKNCPQLNALFTITNPNTIAHELILNINSIIKLIPPLKKVHFKKTI